MNNIAYFILKNKDYRIRKHKVERGDYVTTYSYDGFKQIEFYHTLDLLVFHRPIIKKGIIKTFESCGLDVTFDKNYNIYAVMTVFGYVFGGCHIKYTMNNWDSNFVAVKNLSSKMLAFQKRELIYTLINKRGIGTDQQPRACSKADNQLLSHNHAASSRNHQSPVRAGQTSL